MLILLRAPLPIGAVMLLRTLNHFTDVLIRQIVEVPVIPGNGQLRTFKAPKEKPVTGIIRYSEVFEPQSARQNNEMAFECWFSYWG